ncbi:MAG: hypothetical protein M1824_005492 [Vezdaea acicularis]|nr:MAG: hypothetical protein M1824_005492 [Vezdaea acicularis]
MRLQFRLAVVVAVLVVGCAATEPDKMIVLASDKSDEMVILANCVNVNNVGEQSSQIAYYSSTHNPSPAAIAKVQTPFGKTAFWEGGSPISATFADGNVFSADIPKDISIQGAFVGLGKNNAGTFSCWRDWRPDTYTADGVRCSGIYTCDHRAPPGNEIEVQIEIGQNSVVLEGDVDAWQVFHTVWDRRQARSCDTKPVAIPDTSCTITYECFGATDWEITNAMATTVNGVLAKAVKKVEDYTVRECQEVSDIPPHKCIELIPVKHQRTNIVNHGRLDVTNVSPAGSGIPNSLAGWLTYDISCPTAHGNCAGCKAAELFLMGGAAAGTYTMNPEVAGAFGGLNVLTTAICALGGC